MTFDASRLPRAQLLEEAFPGQELKPDSNGWARVSCTLPGCEHEHGDRPPAGSPSLDVNVDGGSIVCRKSGTQANGWKGFVITYWGEERWRNLLTEHNPSGDRRRAPELTRVQRWEALELEREWVERYQLDPELAALYLRRGRRYPGDPHSETAVGLWVGGQLLGAKFRLERGARWKAAPHDAKYKFWKKTWDGPKMSEIILGVERLKCGSVLVTNVLICAGEKDWLVASTHLDPERWAPITGCAGEGKVPRGLPALVEGRDVVIAYDGDTAGRKGSTKIAAAVYSSAASVRIAEFPVGEDVALAWQRRGSTLLNELLNASVAYDPGVSPAPAPAPAPAATSSPGTSSPPKGPSSSDDEPVVRQVDAWARVSGQIVAWRAGKAEGDPAVAHGRFAGDITVLRERVVHPETGPPSHRVTYQVETGGRTIEREIDGGPLALGQVLDTLAAANDCHSAGAKAQLYQYVHHSSSHEVEEVRQGYGYHPTLGWLCHPDWRIADGMISKSTAKGYLVEPPGEAVDLVRAGFLELSAKRLREVGAWILSDLMQCDHAGGAFTIPLLGAFVCAPLWNYLTVLLSWQRYAFFLQGPSGVGKSQFCRYFHSLWGAYLQPAGLASWRSTHTWVEDLMHRVSGGPVYINDWKLSVFTKIGLKEAIRLIQAYADGGSRGRCGPDARTKASKHPRCQLVIDGEDLPPGEQSTLGRMLVVQVHGSREGRCATAHPGVLDPAMVADMPGVTAAWIAWVQRSVPWLEERLWQAHGDLDSQMPAGSTNRSRVVRNSSANLLAVVGFYRFLEELGVPGVEADRPELDLRALDVHADHAKAQLGLVQAESASEQFLSGAMAVLCSGQMFLAPREKHSGPEPYGPVRTSALQAGVYHLGYAYLYHEVIVPHVQRHVSQGGGDRIAFTQRAISQQLQQDGDMTRKRIGGGSWSGEVDGGDDDDEEGSGGAGGRRWTWRVRLSRIAGAT